MDKPLEELPASALRNLLIEEVKKFIIALDYNSTEDLQAKKLHLRKIFDLITEKEREEAKPLVWGKNSTQAPGTDALSHFIDKIINDLHSD